MDETPGSLAKDPLPPEILTWAPEDTLLPSRIALVDADIRSLKEATAKMQETRAALMDRAIKLNILKDDQFRIKKTETLSDREINPEVFAKEFPDEYDEAVKIEKKDATDRAQALIDKIDEAAKTIRVGTVKTLLKDNEIEKIIFPRKISVSYKLMPLKKGEKPEIAAGAEHGDT
jgi:hypothetical protein